MGGAIKSKSPRAQLAGFLAKYEPEVAAVARAALERLRKRLPSAVQMVYDNYYGLVIGFGPTERPSEAILSIALYPRWVNLYFLDGIDLPDPQKVLQGSGHQVRRIKLESAADLDQPAVRALLAEAVKRSDPPFEKKACGRLIIKAISAKQRPRRPL